MTIKGIGRSILGLGLIGGVVVGPVAAAVLLLDEGEVSPRELRTIINGTNDAVAFNYALGDSYGNNMAEEQNAYANSYMAQLIRTTGVNEKITGVVEGGEADAENPTHEFGDPTDKEFEQSLRLELAEAILIYEEGISDPTYAIFNEGESDEIMDLPKYDVIAESNILYLNDEGTRAVIDDVNNEAVEFVIREGVNWIDNNGNATEYEINAKDFYYSMYQTGLSNNRWRNNPYDPVSNPFGGHGTEGGAYPGEGDETPTTWQLGLDLDSAYNLNKFGAETVGFPNQYLYTMFGMLTPTEMVKDKVSTTITGVSENPNMLGEFGEVDTVRIGGVESVETQFYNGITKFIADGRTLVPVPSQMIDEVEAEKTHARGVEIPEGAAKDLGFYTYGVTHSDLLYASPYYVSESSQFRVTLEQNKHFWDKEWVENEDTVSKYTMDYIQSSDGNIFSQSEFSQFKTDRVYKVDYSSLDSRSQREVLADPRDFGVRYTSPQNTTSFTSDMLPFMMPEAGQDDYLMNDAMSQLWFGAELDDVEAGTQSLNDYLSTEARAFRSQIGAAINWFSFARIVNPDGSHDDWYSFMPPEMDLFTSSNSGKTPYDYKDELTMVNYIDSTGFEYSITSEENMNHYIANGNDATKQLQSVNYEEIKEDVGKMIDGLGLATGEKVEFPIKARQKAPTAQEYDLYEKYEQTIEGLDPRIDVEYQYFGQSWPGDLTTTNGLERFGGWGADYAGIGSMFTGLSSYGSSIQAMASAVENDTALANEFPELATYGTAWETYVNDLRSSLTSVAQPYVLDADELANFTGAEIGSTSGNHGIVTKLIKESADEASETIQSELAEYYFTLDAAVATFDLQHFGSITDDEAIRLITEVREIMGVTFGINRSIPSRELSSPVIYREDLSIPILDNGQSYIQDWRVNQTRAQEFGKVV